MTQAKHTPTPWHWAKSRTMQHLRSESSGSFGVSMPAPGNKTYFREGDDIREANAAFIVRACNAHEELVKALEGLLDVYVDACGVEISEAHPETAAGRARAALAKAKGE